MSDAISSDIQDGVTILRINRPDKKNALTQAMYTALCDGIDAADANPSVRAVLITATPGCFTSGNDINDFLQNPPQDESSPVLRFLHTISHSKKPLVAAVTGLAVGVGGTMLLHCDLVYMAQGATLQFPFTKLGLCPEAASSVLLAQRVGYARACEILLLGEPLPSAAALQYGIANQVVADAEVEGVALAQARKLAALPPQALYTSKALMRRAHRALVEDTIRAEAEQFTQMLRGEEAMEAMMAFMQKRAPDFSRFS